MGTAEAYLLNAFTRPTELFTPSSPGSSSGSYVLYPNGFDQMMGIRLGVQVSGQFSSALNVGVSQLISVHETGHLFGAPHCDPLQGYVMCGGEHHPHYLSDGIFVWHKDSFDLMQYIWD